ncbi:MAG TPA: acyl-CoA synthetase [Candidatus Pacebacteria bacterium]|nr:acyl-CoA synthetase [Candidatus Paceibacterota bacterium]
MSFSALFYPKAIAVIGASRKIKTVGNDIIKNLVTQGYQGEIYPVNPKADVLYGRQVYATVGEIPGQIDLAVIAVPTTSVLQMVREAAARGATAIVVISAGYKEIGNLEQETELAQLCAQLGVSLIGPNCLGVLNAEIKMNASFAATMPKAGNIAFISQSGALCTAVLDYAKELGIGFSKFVSIGNKADVNELRLIEYFAEDPKTAVIAIYVEQLTGANQLIAAIQKITRGPNPKPVLFIKAGRTTEGATAVASHTGSLSAGDAAYTALFNQSGAIRAVSISELFEFAKIFSKNQLGKLEKVAIITNAGGPGVLTTDEVIDNGLQLAKLASETTEALKAVLPPAASVKNPIDVLGDAMSDRYEQALTLVERDPNVDGLIVVLTPQSMTEVTRTAHAIINLRHNSRKPIAVSFMGSEIVEPGIKLMKEAGVVTTDFPESAAKAMAIFGRFYTWSQTQKGEVKVFTDVNSARVKEIFAAAKSRGQTNFPEAEALEILANYNFPLLKRAHAETAQQAAELLRGNSGKFAMKIVSPDILHKSDVGGVMLNITAENVTEKFMEMQQVVLSHQPEAKLNGVILMEMAPSQGQELILGATQISGLGTLLMFGLGGIYVEVIKDVVFAFAPLTETEARRLIESLKVAALFKGVRGQPPVDTEALVAALCRLSQLVMDFPEIIELDINPLLGLSQGQGAVALDARVVIG